MYLEVRVQLFQLFIQQINENNPITITDKKVKRYFMTINEACFLLMLCVKIKYSEKCFNI